MESSTPEENPAEPVPDVAGAAEPAQPAEPEEISAELETEIHENENQDTEGASSTADDINEVENSSTDESKSIEEKLQLKKKPLTSSKTNMENKDKDGEGSIQNSPSKEFKNKQSQTFFKYMKNVTDIRCVQIMNQEVNHGNSDLIFYRSSKELLKTIDFLESNID
ncbi:uncharacterized protein LOC107266200 isoform X1 [Cephus cinctus]|uniref:Uncharacterized protein LOC107266200 isoform X1 n=1 Tax=Cephus cinctus TaxID=211228 RepID=A0AAJ7VZS9_CEPCN|nr:uncharacterized protein LOC107266200 isoform X1 [Cephus cinctus]XP_024939289.1 uncharacterized protein LOC107266200 isoform X1 [Cephus cinctus]XP_024939290.1 uncharacterized protein LOC107266200 isoform X1 [Cephus cinctus]XP_024939291.1 uncharacterized protein LOC107266200 isoform X1 [Cephus cinctus]